MLIIGLRDSRYSSFRRARFSNCSLRRGASGDVTLCSGRRGREAVWSPAEVSARFGIRSINAKAASSCVLRPGARPRGLEPLTLGSEDRCSIQLSYGRKQLMCKPLRRFLRFVPGGHDTRLDTRPNPKPKERPRPDRQAGYVTWPRPASGRPQAILAKAFVGVKRRGHPSFIFLAFAQPVHCTKLFRRGGITSVMPGNDLSTRAGSDRRERAVTSSRSVPLSQEQSLGCVVRSPFPCSAGGGEIWFFFSWGCPRHLRVLRGGTLPRPNECDLDYGWQWHQIEKNWSHER